MGSLCAPRGRPRPYRRRIGPNRGGGACACVWQGAQEGGRHGGPLGSPRAIYTGQVAVACACALVELCVLLSPCPVRSDARLSRPCSRRVRVVALAHTVGGGTGSGS